MSENNEDKDMVKVEFTKFGQQKDFNDIESEDSFEEVKFDD